MKNLISTFFLASGLVIGGCGENKEAKIEFPVMNREKIREILVEHDFSGERIEKQFEKLDKEIFPHRQIGLLHGRLKSQDKDYSSFARIIRLQTMKGRQ